MNIAIDAAKSFNAFARFTVMHTLFSMRLTPCAHFLFQWLLQQKPAGREQEIDLHEFQAFTGLGRKRPYCLKQIRNALMLLIEAGLVDLVRQYNARYWKVIAYHPDQTKSRREKKKPTPIESKISQEQLSNPSPDIPSYREYRETTDTVPSTHPVKDKDRLGDNFDDVSIPIGQVEEKEGGLVGVTKTENTKQEISEEKEGTPIFSEEKILEPQLKSQIEQIIAPAPMNPQIKKVVLEANLEAVQDAIAVVKQRKEVGRVKNPAGLFVKAVKELWKPSAGKDAQNSIPNLSDGFSRWFDAARAAGLVIGTQVIDGQIWVYDANAKAFTYEQMARLHPLESFKGATSIPLEKKPRLVSVAAKESVDLSDLLAIIDNHFSRLKWSAQRIREFLVQTYGKYSRALLDDDDLIDLQVRLQAL